MTNNNNSKENNMTNKMTSKETENMTLAQFQAAMREGKVEVKREG